VIIIYQLFKTTVIIGLSQVFIILMQIIRAKIIAVYLGPEGTSILGNTISFMNLLESIFAMGVSISLLRYASESIQREDFSSVNRYYSSSLIFNILSSTFGIIICIFFLKEISINVYGKEQNLVLLIFILFTLPVNLIYNIVFNLVNSFNDIKLMAYINILSTLISLLAIIPLIIILGKEGLLISIIANSIIQCIFITLLFRKKYNNLITFKLSYFNRGYLCDMIKYGFVNQVAIIFNSFSILFLRLLVINKLTVVDSGIFNAAFSLASYILIFQRPVAVYSYPKFSSIHHNTQEMNNEINRIIKFSIICLTPILCFILTFSEGIIKLLLSGSFVQMVNILSILFLAKYFEILQGIIALPLLITGKFKGFLGANLFFNIIVILLSKYLFILYGINGLTIGYLASFLILFILYLIINYKVLKIKLKASNWFILIVSSTLILLSNLFTDELVQTKYLFMTFIFVLTILIIKKEEWIKFFKIVMRKGRMK